MNSIHFGNSPKITAPKLLKEQIAMAAYNISNASQAGMSGVTSVFS